MMPTHQQENSPKVIEQSEKDLLTYPPPPETGGLTITTDDLTCLEGENFINDAIIEFYLRYILKEKLTPYQRDATHLFTSFFYSRLIHNAEKPHAGETLKNLNIRRHRQVRNWTKHVDIFSKDFIVMPIHQGFHWTVVIICYPGKVQDVPESALRPAVKSNESSDNVSFAVEQEAEFDKTRSKVIIRELRNKDKCLEQDGNSTSKANSACLVEKPPGVDPETPDGATAADGEKRDEMPCICHFDSFFEQNNFRLFPALQGYLEMEWKTRKGTDKVFDQNTMPGLLIKCPKQVNFWDCAIYLLHFVEKFFTDPFPYYSNPMPDMTDWFEASEVSEMRQELKDLIMNLSQKQRASANAGNA